MATTLWFTHSANYLIDSGKWFHERSEIDLAALALWGVSEDREEVMRRGRINVANYICFPGADPMVPFNGVGRAGDFGRWVSP